MRVLVAGAFGQLGQALLPALGRHAVVGLPHAELDITQPEAVRTALERHRPELVINAAAYNAVDAAESDPAGAFALNEAGPRNLAAAAAAVDATIVHVSTDYVFDGEARTPYDETSLPRPRSVYGESKLAGERAVQAANPRHWIVRTAWLYAARGHNFPLTMLRLAKAGGVRVVADQTGSPTYAPHLAAAIARLVEGAPPFGLYHLAGSGAATWYELTVALFRRVAVAATVTPVTTDAFPRPAPRPRYSVLTSVREPRIVLPSWEEGLDAFVMALGAET